MSGTEHPISCIALKQWKRGTATHLTQMLTNYTTGCMLSSYLENMREWVYVLHNLTLAPCWPCAPQATLPHQQQQQVRAPPVLQLDEPVRPSSTGGNPPGISSTSSSRQDVATGATVPAPTSPGREKVRNSLPCH